MDVEVGGVDHHVRQVLQLAQQVALGVDGVGEVSLAEGVGTAVLLISADQRSVFGVEEEHETGQTLAIELVEPLADGIDGQSAA